MKPICRMRSLSAAALFLVCAGRALASQVVRYDVTVSDPNIHRLKVQVTVDQSDSAPLKLAMPAWTPGYYQILDFQKDVSDFRAEDTTAHALAVEHPDDKTWQVKGFRGTIVCSYNVKAEDAGFGFFRSHVDAKTGYVNGASALMYVVGGKERPATITYHLPAGWLSACSLDPIGEGKYKAADYDELIDCPAQLGEFDRLDFSAHGTPFGAIVVGPSDVDRTALKETLQRISSAAIDLFGYSPFKRYFFIIHFASGNFGGGLEHRNSTVLNVDARLGGARYPLAGLAAHEYFHAWNVKRLHPAVLGPFDYAQKVRTGALWWAEGVTDYDAEVLLRMAGINTTEQFLASLASRITELQRTGARQSVTAEEASRKAWEGGSVGFGGLSYYLKGALLGLVFDIKIRAAAGGAKSLDDVMRLLDEQYGKKGIGYPEDGLLTAINQIAGRDLSDLYHRYVQTTEEIPWNDVLRDAGLQYVNANDQGAYLGVSTRETTGGGLVIDAVEEKSPAAEAGLERGDELVSLDGVRVTRDGIQAAAPNLKPGQKVTIRVTRDGTPRDIPITLGARPRPARIERLPNLTPATIRILDGLLRSQPGRAALAPCPMAMAA